MLNRSEDWLRHSRSDRTHWNAPPYEKRGRAVVYRLADVLEYAQLHGIQLPAVRGGK